MARVGFEQVGDVAVITMDDGKANALSPEMIEELGAALDRAQAEAKAILLTGRPGMLCAGFDLKVIVQGGEVAKALFTAGGELLLRIYTHPQPVVVAATGHAIAGGALILGVADFRVGAEGSYKIGLNEVSIGAPLPVFAHAIARERLDRRHLVRGTVLATLYSPEEAARVGWLDDVVPADSLQGTAMAAATRFAALNPLAFAMSKDSMRRELADRVRAGNDADLTAIVEGLGMG